jgi:predicted ATPase with chaperone activity
MTFPPQFMLVAAMNLTPDGKMPGESRCSPREIQNYLNRVSGPLLDRIDIHVREHRCRTGPHGQNDRESTCRLPASATRS